MIRSDYRAPRGVGARTSCSYVAFLSVSRRRPDRRAGEAAHAAARSRGRGRGSCRSGESPVRTKATARRALTRRFLFVCNRSEITSLMGSRSCNRSRRPRLASGGEQVAAHPDAVARVRFLGHVPPRMEVWTWAGGQANAHFGVVCRPGSSRARPVTQMAVDAIAFVEGDRARHDLGRTRCP